MKKNNTGKAKMVKMDFQKELTILLPVANEVLTEFGNRNLSEPEIVMALAVIFGFILADTEFDEDLGFDLPTALESFKIISLQSMEFFKAVETNAEEKMNL